MSGAYQVVVSGVLNRIGESCGAHATPSCRAVLRVCARAAGASPDVPARSGSAAEAAEEPMASRAPMRAFLARACSPPPEHDEPNHDLGSKCDVGNLERHEQRLHVLFVGVEVGLQVLGELLMYRP